MTPTIEQGNNSIARREGDLIIKKRPEGRINLFENTYAVQAKLWNQYYAGTPYEGAYVNDKGEFCAPFIEGHYPTDPQKLAKAKQMLDAGFVMLDCRDKRNFICKDGDVYPVDFGQIFSQESSPKFYQTYARVTRQYIQNQPTQTSDIPKAQETCFKRVEKVLMILEDYASKLEDTDTKDAINNFITDTRTRINDYRRGNSNAFDSYQRANAGNLKAMGNDKVAAAAWKSIAVILATGVVPGLIVGAVQYLATEGDSFLFFDKLKSSSCATEVINSLTTLAKPTLVT